MACSEGSTAKSKPANRNPWAGRGCGRYHRKTTWIRRVHPAAETRISHSLRLSHLKRYQISFTGSALSVVHRHSFVAPVALEFVCAHNQHLPRVARVQLQAFGTKR